MSHIKKGDRTMQVERIGLDIAKSSFQVHGVDAHGKVVIRKQLTRGKCLATLLRCRRVSWGWKLVAGHTTGRGSWGSWGTTYD